MTDPVDTSDPRVERVAGPIVSVTAENPGPLTLDGTRSWIVGRERVAIIDPGPDDPTHLDRIHRAVAGRPVVAVCLTHAHGDHSAAARAAASRWGALRASSETLSRIRVEGIDDCVPLEDGDTIVIVEGSILHAIATPGHSGDHLAFMLSPDRIAFTGDLVLGRGSSMVAHPDGSVGSYLASLARLRALRPTRLMPGHGPVVEDADAKLSEYARHRLERTDQVRAAVEEGARTMSDLLAAVYGELPAGVVQAAELSLLAHLEHLTELGVDHPLSASGRQTEGLSGDQAAG